MNQKEYLKLGTIKTYADKQSGEPYKKVVVAVDNLVELAKRVAHFRGQNRYMYLNLLDNNPQWDPGITWDATQEPIVIQQQQGGYGGQQAAAPQQQYRQPMAPMPPKPPQGASASREPGSDDDLPF